ncbi:MAG: hypothetical protein U0002_01595 [Thermoanaerobaculia bacterium]
MRSPALFARALLLLALAHPLLPAQAALSPVGDQFQVNETIAGDQRPLLLKVAPGGSFLVVWEDVATHQLRARRFAADGTPAGSEFSLARSGAVGAATTTGGFRVAYAVPDPGFPDDTDIELAELDGSGALVGTPTPANTLTVGSQGGPHVDVAADGRFVLAWDTQIGVAGDPNGVRARPFSSGGSGGTERSVNPPSLEFQAPAAVSVAPDGSFAIAYTDGDFGGDYFLARFLADGTPVGGVMHLGDSTFFNTEVLALAGNAFVALGQNLSDGGTFVRRYGGDAGLLASQAVVDPPVTLTAPDTVGKLAMDRDGNVAVTLDSFAGPGAPDNSNVYLRLFGPDLSPLTDLSLVNTFTAGEQGASLLAVTPRGGRLVVVWQSEGSPGTDASGTSIQARVFLAPWLMRDGFETGDLSGWAAVSP